MISVPDLSLMLTIDKDSLSPLSLAIEILNGNLGFYPKEYNKSESPAELVKRINAYYNEKQSN